MERLGRALVFFLSFTFVSATAREKESCDKKPLSNESAGATELANLARNVRQIVEKDWYAASEKMVAKAACRNELPDLAQMEKELLETRRPTGSVQINEVSLSSEDPELAAHFLEMINKEKAFEGDFDVKTDLSGEEFKGCPDVVCLSKKVFGEKQGIKFLWMKSKFGLNPSHIVEPSTRPWKTGEIDPYLKAVVNLPPSVLPIERNKTFTHDKEENGNTMANASITFFAGVDDESEARKEYTAFHELAHYIAGEEEMDRHPEWLHLSGWELDLEKQAALEEALAKAEEEDRKRREQEEVLNWEPEDSWEINLDFNFNTSQNDSFSLNNYSWSAEKDTFYIGEREDPLEKIFGKQISMLELISHYDAMVSNNTEKIISKYGESNPSEDFAESLTAYRYNPAGLKKAAPEKYNFIKDRIFNGQEFINHSSCPF